MHTGKAFVVLIVIIALPWISPGDTFVESLLSAYRLTPGIALRSTEFDVYNKGSLCTNGPLSEDFSYWPFITLSSPYKYFGESSWGGLME